MSWREEYLTALKSRHEQEKTQYELIDAYTRLADKVAGLEAEKASGNFPTTESTDQEKQIAVHQNVEAPAYLKRDLAEALRSKGQLQGRLKIAEEELQKLKIKNIADAKLIKGLTMEKTTLVTKVRDRDEELRGKAKLLENMQDEVMSQDLQLNMADERAKKLQKDNQELIDRWMARMGQEADAMNEASKFS